MDEKGWNAGGIANILIAKAFLEGAPVTVMALDRLVYIAHGFHLALRGRPLVDELPDLKPWGATLDTITATLAPKWGSGRVQGLATDRGGRALVADLDAHARAIVDEVWNQYGAFEGHQLSALCRPTPTLLDRARHKVCDATTVRHFQGFNRRTTEEPEGTDAATPAAPDAREADAFAILGALRAEGWSVAVHNDYRLAGEHHTFYLFTHPDGRWAKGEGRSDAAALAQAAGQARRATA